jgi:diaminohydroxyphosphoribosylaminopyrimidine deaminase/5-amino-6-(5-phosphoribosylamino)uracil reductase
MVGALVVKTEKVLGAGYHKAFGAPHAEVNALGGLGDEAKGATLYVNLEPCSHYGKTPPCIDLIIDKEIGQVVVGTADPNPRVAGRGIQGLRDRGIRVTVGVLEGECRLLNESFFKYWETGLPFITLKMAQSLDGRIATKTGSSRWISSPPTLKLAHRLRARHDAIMVGIHTVLQDNPSLTVRLVKGKNPRRLILDSHMRVPLDSQVLSDGNTGNTILLTTEQADPKRIERLLALGARVHRIKADDRGRVDLFHALQVLAREGITSILVEGGAKLATSFLRSNLADKLVLVIAGKIIGKGTEAIGDLGIARVDEAIRFHIEKVRRLGEDLVVTARPKVNTGGSAPS